MRSTVTLVIFQTLRSLDTKEVLLCIDSFIHYICVACLYQDKYFKTLF